MDGFSFVYPYIVRVSDVNYGGHVANSAVLNIFQDARIPKQYMVLNEEAVDFMPQMGPMVGYAVTIVIEL